MAPLGLEELTKRFSEAPSILSVSVLVTAAFHLKFAAAMVKG